MFESIINFFKNFGKSDKKENHSRDTAKERLHLVLMQDRANVSADFLDLMREEIIEVIKKYVDVDEREIDVRMTNKQNEDGSSGTPLLYANIPIVNIKNDILVEKKKEAEKIKNEEQGNDQETDSGENHEEAHEENHDTETGNVNDETYEEKNEPTEGMEAQETVNQN